MKEATQWGIAALHRAAEGLRCKTAAHFCYGYGIKPNIDWKASLGVEWRRYEAIFPERVLNMPPEGTGDADTVQRISHEITVASVRFTVSVPISKRHSYLAPPAQARANKADDGAF